MPELLSNEETKTEEARYDLSRRNAPIASTQRADTDDEKSERQRIESGPDQIERARNPNVWWCSGDK
ncbi:hypothetical protein BJA01nite_38060 [Bradyrhizobium japonicum]|nr:hypothetical protein BJ6T_33110 [Bradyrhizobium japonicum USDA 6]GEC46164.1 hypothetical protein BJA01nite_38060 [Bradyrhizobium japonicum]